MNPVITVENEVLTVLELMVDNYVYSVEKVQAVSATPRNDFYIAVITELQRIVETYRNEVGS